MAISNLEPKMTFDQKRRDQLVTWGKEKEAALSLKRALPWWPAIVLAVGALLVTGLKSGDHPSVSLMIHTAMGWNLATMYLLIKGDRMSRRADQKLYADQERAETEVAI